jgi:hypothetical protein
MTTIHLDVTTPVTPERILSAFTDFTPQRLHKFPNIDPRYYEVHAVHATSAEVTEGSALFWKGMGTRSLWLVATGRDHHQGASIQCLCRWQLLALSHCGW